MKKQFLKGAAAALLITAFAGCDNLAGNNNQSTETLRYSTVPLAASDGKAYSMVASAYDDTYYYYIYLLGHIERVPMVYGDAVEYDGETPITVAYEKSKCKEESVMESMTTTVENSVTKTNTYNAGISATGTIKKGIVSASMTLSFNYEHSEEEMQSRSTSNTWETTQTKVEGESSSISYTIGENNQPQGKYRTTLFGTTDVYYVLITTKAFAFEEAYILPCARSAETLYWGIDYDPDTSGDFGKTAKTANLATPEVDLTTLTAPTDELTKETIPEDLKTEWTATKTDQHRINHSGNEKGEGVPLEDRFTADFDLAKLKSQGYTKFTIKIDFMVKPIDDGWVDVWVFAPTSSWTTNENNEVGRSYNTLDPEEGRWNNLSLEFFMPIGSFSNYLVIKYGANGTDADDYTLDDRTVTLTAVIK